MNIRNPQQHTNRGFALLFSIIVISVVILTTLAVSSLVRRGLDLTSIGERSMEAFFAADAGLECALYWDIKEREEEVFRGASRDEIECFGDDNIEVASYGGGSYGFEIDHQGVCAVVSVQISGLTTEVRSRGFNTCDASDPGRIERGLRAEY